MKKFILFCTMAMAILLSACGGASGNINKAFDIVKQKGDADKVFEYISSPSYNYESMSMEDMVKLNMCVQYVNSSSWGHINDQTKDQKKVLGDILTELTNRQRTFTPEQLKEYMECVGEIMNQLNNKR